MSVTIQEIKALLERSNKAVEEATLRLYERQTEDEQYTETTTHKNGRGFSAFDAEIMSSFAKQILANRWGRPKGFRLTEKQMAVARRKILHYAKQLKEVADAKEAAQYANEEQRPLRLAPDVTAEAAHHYA